MSICAKAVETIWGRFMTLLGKNNKTIDDVEVKSILAYAIFNIAFQCLHPMGTKFDEGALVCFYVALERLCESLKLPPTAHHDNTGMENLPNTPPQPPHRTVYGRTVIRICRFAGYRTHALYAWPNKEADKKGCTQASVATCVKRSN